jgi:hypothetical protein
MSEFDYTAFAELFISAGRSGLRYRQLAQQPLERATSFLRLHDVEEKG